MLLAICNYDYYENDLGPVLRILTRNEQNERVTIDIQDESLAPHFFLLKRHYKLFMSIMEETGLIKRIIKMSDGPPTEYDEPTFAIYTKYPRHVRAIRNVISVDTGIGEVGLNTYQADVKWEKMVTQQMGFKQFIEVDDDKISKWGFTPLSAIKNTDKIFDVKFRICYWDIETDGREAPGRQWADCRFAYKIPIISYVAFDNYTQEFTYYAWKDDWEDTVYETTHKSEVGEKARNMALFKDYPYEFKLIVKKFKHEKNMHEAFIYDFARNQYDGLMTFNGRGGNRIIRGKRKWYTGFDMPMFYERLYSLGLIKLLQTISPVNHEIKRNKLIQQSVKRRVRKNDYGQEMGREYQIKAIPQHDLLYDDNVLFYTKNEYEMKRHNLDTYLSHFLGFTKVEHPGESVVELFLSDPEKEMRYNVVDVEGLYALDLYFGYTTDVALRSLAYGGKIEDGVYASKLHDHIKLWFTNGRYVLPTREYGRKSNREDQWEGFLKKKFGGFNLEVSAGLYGYNEVMFGAIIDFSKLYPSCSRSVNADTRTKVNLDKIEIGSDLTIYLVDRRGNKYAWNDCARSPAGFFTKEFKAIDAVIYDEMIQNRNMFSKRMAQYAQLESQSKTKEDAEKYHRMYNIYYAIQFSLKGVINGKYGADGMEGTRGFDMVVYNTPPSMGQILIKKVISLLDSQGYKSVLASTDSALIMVNSKTAIEAWDETQKIIGWINKELDIYVREEFNVLQNYISLGCEKVFDMAIIFDKRRYMLNTVIKEEGGKVIILDEPKPHWRGLEIVRRDTAMITHEVQEKLLNMIRKRETIVTIINYIRSVDEKFERTRNANNRPKEISYEEWDCYSWSYICGRAGISMAINEGSGQKYDACRNANKYFGKQYDAGVNPLLGIFTKHPLDYNDRYIENGKFVMAFDETDEFVLKKDGFDLDYDKIKQTHLIDKVEEILKLCFNMSYREALADFDDLFDYD